MNSLKIIQTISKIGEIISKIIYICSIVGLCISAVALILLPYGDDVLKIGGVTLKSLFSDVEDLKALCPAVGSFAINCIGYIVLSREAQRYFSLEIKEGTPFTFNGANLLKRLGIITIIVPILVTVAAEIFCNVFENITNSTAFSLEELNFDNEGSIAMGLMLLLLSVLCRCGAELIENKDSRKNIPGENEAV